MRSVRSATSSPRVATITCIPANGRTHTPGALLHGAVGLGKRRKDLAIDSELRGETHADWESDLDTTFLDRTMLNETVFFHPPSRSLIVADVIESGGRDVLMDAYTRLKG